MLPAWASALIVTAVLGVGGYIVRFLMLTSKTLGKIEQAFLDWGRRLSGVETWQADRDAEIMAQRNGYTKRQSSGRPPEWWQ